jgi:hypothetical protein
MQDVIIVPADEADATREALGRAYAEALARPYPIPPDVVVPGRDGRSPEGLTLYYADALVSADGVSAAFKIGATILPQLGKIRTLTDGRRVMPTTEVSKVDLATWATDGRRVMPTTEVSKVDLATWAKVDTAGLALGNDLVDATVEDKWLV